MAGEEDPSHQSFVKDGHVTAVKASGMTGEYTAVHMEVVHMEVVDCSHYSV